MLFFVTISRQTAGLGEAEINALPKNVRYYRCEGQYEKGDPYCTEKKYTEEVCPGRIGAANWHPGWKAHALVGNAMALFLTEILEGAVRQIEEEAEGPEEKGPGGVRALKGSGVVG